MTEDNIINTVKDDDPYEVQRFDGDRLSARHGYTSLTDARGYAQTLRDLNRNVPGFRVEVVTRTLAEPHLPVSATIEQTGSNAWRITTSVPYGNGWGVGVDFPTEQDADVVARMIVLASRGEAAKLVETITNALHVDPSENPTADYDALAQVADVLGIVIDTGLDFEPGPDPDWMNP